MPLRFKLPWVKEPAPESSAEVKEIDPETCTHPKLDVEMHGTAVKRRWCIVCGKDLTQHRA